MKLREKQGATLIFLNESIKKKTKTSDKSQNKSAFVKPWLQGTADSSAYNNLLQMHILLLKSKKQSLVDVFFRCSLK